MLSDRYAETEPSERLGPNKESSMVGHTAGSPGMIAVISIEQTSN